MASISPWMTLVCLGLVGGCRNKVVTSASPSAAAASSSAVTERDEISMICDAFARSGVAKQPNRDDAERMILALEWVGERLTLPTVKKEYVSIERPGLTAVQKTELLDYLAARVGLAECPLADVFASGGSKRPDMSIVEGSKANYLLDRTEVTVRAYTACVTAKHCSEPTARGAEGWDSFCNWRHPEGRNEHPINCVDAQQAADFCAWKGRRLPTRDEWTWAAGGGPQELVHPWGSEPPSPSRLNLCGKECVAAVNKKLGVEWEAIYQATDPYPDTAPVGSFPHSRYRLRDMSGNVSEWTSTVEDARTVLAGVSWLTKSTGASATTTTKTIATLRDPSVGFRCAWSAP